jgi:hypothetical protein
MSLQMPIPGNRFAKIAAAWRRNAGRSKPNLDNTHDV